MNGFHYVLEQELFKLYFTSLPDVDRNIHHIKLDIPTTPRQISSIKYLIQLINHRIVVQEITVTCKYDGSKRILCIDTHLPIGDNKLTPPERLRILPPDKDITIEFSRFEDTHFCAILNDKIIGFIDTTSKDRVDIESVVKCFIMKEEKKRIDDILLILPKPCMNKGGVLLNLTHQYRTSLSRDICTKRDHFINIGVTRIKYDQDRSILIAQSTQQKFMVKLIDIGNGYLLTDSTRVY